MKRFIKTLAAWTKYMFTKKDPTYGDIGYFSKYNPQTFAYTYANWGSRRWECYYLVEQLNKINIRGKHIVDIGIGPPAASNFYTFYVKSDCTLSAFDPDDRLKEIEKLSEKCTIYRKPGEHMDILKDNSVDVVVVLSAFEHFPITAFQETLKEVHRVLKTDGHFLITLDLTFDKIRSAPWAILEKTLNNLPERENNLPLKESDQHITLPYFLHMLEPYFYVKNPAVHNNELLEDDLLYNKTWNSYIAYMHLYKK